MRPRSRLFTGVFGLASLAMLTSECSAAGHLPSVDAPTSWAQFRLNPRNNPVLPGTLRVAWHLKTNGGFSSSPTLAGTTLYVGNNAGQVLAVNVENGKPLWTYRVTNPVMSAPIIDGNLIFVAEGNENSPTDSTPARPLHVGDGPNAIVALNQSDGKVVWSRALDGTGMPTPAIVNGVLVHHDGAGNIVGLNPQTGAVVYERNIHSIASMVAALPLWGNRWVTAGEWTNDLWTFRASDGTTLWSTHFSRVASGLGDCPPVTDGLRIYCDYIVPPSAATEVVVGDSANERAYAVDVNTGKKIWDVQIDSGTVPPRNEAAIPLIADGMVFMGSSMEPVMTALDPATGKIVWQRKVNGNVLNGPVCVDSVLYFGDLGGYLWALDAKTGNLIGNVNAHMPFNVGSAIVTGETLIIGSRGGTLIAVPLKVIRDSHDA
jgi:outer membrane protein assembly factor BamB